MTRADTHRRIFGSRALLTSCLALSAALSLGLSGCRGESEASITETRVAVEADTTPVTAQPAPSVSAPAATPAVIGTPTVPGTPPVTEAVDPAAHLLRLQTYLDFSDEEMGLLSDLERTHLPLWPMQTVDYAREPSEEFLDRRAKIDPTVPPKLMLTGSREALPTEGLTAPTLLVDNTDTLHPTFTVNDAPDDAIIYLEIDTSPDFQSLDRIRFPSLATMRPVNNRARRGGTEYTIFRPRRDGWALPNQPFTLPFRVTAFAKPTQDETVDFAQFAKYAQLLGFGLNRDEIITEVYEVMSRRIDRGGATAEFSPLETFMAGTNECGQQNALAGTVLEINDVPVRGVAGFHPWVRTVYKGGGHSAIEALNSRNEWEYVDTFLGVHTPGISAIDLAAAPATTPIIKPTPDHLVGKLGLEDHYRLGDLFRYRFYYDKAGRIFDTPISQIMGLEDDFARDLPVRKLTEEEIFNPTDDLPDETTVYVRARYILSDKCTLVNNVGCGDPRARVSPWTTTQFTIRPKLLLAASSN